MLGRLLRMFSGAGRRTTTTRRGGMGSGGMLSMLFRMFRGARRY